MEGSCGCSENTATARRESCLRWAEKGQVGHSKVPVECSAKHPVKLETDPCIGSGGYKTNINQDSSHPPTCLLLEACLKLKPKEKWQRVSNNSCLRGTWAYYNHGSRIKGNQLELMLTTCSLGHSNPRHCLSFPRIGGLDWCFGGVVEAFPMYPLQKPGTRSNPYTTGLQTAVGQTQVPKMEP